MTIRTLLLTTVVALVASTGSLATAQVSDDEIDATHFSAPEWSSLFQSHHLSGLSPLGPPPMITGKAELDSVIRSIAESRGYQRRAEPSVALAVVDGVRLQPDAAAAWTSLRLAAADAGHSLILRSGYRSYADQTFVFNAKFTDRSDTGIDRRLQTVAAPGYSKHHTGYAADITQSGHSVFSFYLTSGYAWLAADNFANAKRHGWIPSYPDGAPDQGPEPEPWELVWVGRTNIVCGDFQSVDGRTFCDTAGRSQHADIEWLAAAGITNGCEPERYCVDAPITRGEFVTMLWRHSCRPGSEVDTPFVDLDIAGYYTPAVRWAWSAEVTLGVDPNHFGPDYPITRAEAVTLLWRRAGRPFAAADAPFEDTAEGAFYAPAVDWAHEVAVVRGTAPTTFEPDSSLTRGEAASVIHRLDRTGIVDRASCSAP